jgi:hypothetical protein
MLSYKRVYFSSEGICMAKGKKWGPGHPLYEYLKAKGYKVGRKGKKPKGKKPKSTSRSAAAKKAWATRRGK